MQGAVERILAGQFHNGVHSLDFSTPRIELSLNEGDVYEGSFFILGPENVPTEGIVSVDGIRMQCLTESFSGREEEIAYRFDSSDLTEGEKIQGEFRIISNQGEYSIPYEVSIAAAHIESSLGSIRNLFHFANLAKTHWEEAVKLFYSKEFEQIFQGVDKQYYVVYRGLSGGEEKEQNVEEFLLEVKKKQKVEFIPEETKIRIDNLKENREYHVVINRNGWGFSHLTAEAEGDFLVLEKTEIRDEDFLGNCYRLPYYISENNLHSGKNYGRIRLYNAYTCLEIEVLVYCQSMRTKVPGIRTEKNHIQMELMQYYEAFRTKKINASTWMQETEKILERLLQMDDRDISAKLFKVQLLITQERYNEADWFLRQVKELLKEEYEPGNYCYYLYLTTLLNRDEAYIDETGCTGRTDFYPECG